MAEGEYLAPVRFAPDIRNKLTTTVDSAITELGLQPTDGSELREKIIRALEDVATMVPALSSPRLSTITAALKSRALAIGGALDAIDQPHEIADQLVDEALRARGWNPGQMRRALEEGLREYREVLEELATITATRRGRPSEIAAYFMTAEVSRILTNAGLPGGAYEGGLLTNVVRILSPPVLHREAPEELRPWFKWLKSHREKTP